MNRNILSTERIYFELTEERHLENRVNYINDSEIQGTLNYDFPTSLYKTKKWFANHALDSSRVDFAIMCKETDKMIGFCGFIKIEKPVMKAELHIVVGDKNYWGGGFGGEAYKLLCNYGFIELGLNRIYGYQLGHNEKAHNAIKKIGWEFEGYLREDLFSHGTTKGRHVVSIIRKDWEKHSSYDI
ncbi:aminoglycoside N(6')-acetyltransferase [Patiriisocius marinistellae]|uniref:Aminoglycoside N(6')-acetyltransferase n=1 Tax=Patiriisocius marinistellae TaxID=2494560 RepID=A0A5J4G2U6_9FLAO|nr:GNAT family protein [Patiriisocius marinistellae]GEQ87199.1 aminoglycoside N(6')-acetyltransferase [Patiriisocius marinistellae]